jgi:hypothetical protein
MAKDIRKKRRETMIALLSGSIIGSTPSVEYAIIIGEFQETDRASSIEPNNRKNILKILHSTRALDTTLKCFLELHGIRDSSDFALGAYLTRLTNHRCGSLSKLNESSRRKYQENIVDKRNVYMHKAGKYPNTENEVNEILSDIESCVVEVLSLERIPVI